MISSRLRDAARDAQLVAADLERGQASSPLADHFLELAREVDQQGLSIAVVALSPEDRRQALAWVLGDAYADVRAQSGNLPGLIEIRSGAPGYVLESESESASRQVFDGLEPLLAALEVLQRETALPDSDDQWFRLGLPVSTSGAPVSLLVARDLDAVTNHASVANALVSRCQLLIVAGRAGAQLTGTQSLTAASLADGIGIWLPVITDAGSPSSSSWCARIPAAAVTIGLRPASVMEPPPTVLASAADELRPLVLLAAHQRRLNLAVHSLIERHELALRQAQSRKAREEQAARPSTGLPTEPAARRAFERLKQRVLVDTSALAKMPAERARRSRIAEGPLRKALLEQLESLTPEDLRQKPGAKAVQLSLDAAFQGHLQRVIKKVLKEELRADLAGIRDGLEALRAELERDAEQARGEPLVLALPPVDEARIWSGMSELVSVEIRYRGEVPLRGFWQRLGEGRRMVFGVMMILSLVGSLGGVNWRGFYFIGLAFFLLFVGAVFWTYRSWQREDRERFEQELVKVREQLAMECDRMAQEAQREKEARLQEYFDTTRRMWGSRLDECANELQQRELVEVQQQRERALVRARRADQVTRDLAAMQGRVGRLRQDCAALDMDIARQVRDTARRQKLLP